MSPPSERTVAEALEALQRLHHHGIVPLEEARDAARLIAGDPALEFPPSAPIASSPAHGSADSPDTQTPS